MKKTNILFFFFYNKNGSSNERNDKVFDAVNIQALAKG